MRKRTSISVTAFLVCALVLSALIAPAALAYSSYPLQPAETEVASALDYLRGQQAADGGISDFATSAWATMAVAAAGEDPRAWTGSGGDSVVDYLAANADSASTLKDYCRMTLAIVAADEDPTAFGGRDFVSLVEAAYDGTQMGDSSLLNDDFWGVLALVSAGTSLSAPAIVDTIAVIESNQNVDGGWSWGVGQGSDVDDTAAAIMALIAGGESESSSSIHDGLAYIESMQTDSGGFESWGSTNSATDSWGVDAIVAAGQDPTGTAWESSAGNIPLDDLLTFQNADGSFNWQPATPSNKALMTSYAIQALVGAPYPVRVASGPAPTPTPTLPPGEVSVRVRVEGENATIWQGDVTVSDSTIVDEGGNPHYLADPTALGAMDEASQAGGFPYVVQDMAFGLYLYSVDDEAPEGWSGWMYRVDYASPMVGAADFVLGETTPPDPPHAEVLFFWGAWDDLPLKMTLDKTTVAVDEPFTATVTYYDDGTGAWVPLEGAIVHAGQDYTTGAGGTVSISVDHDASLQVRAEMDGYIRSDMETVIVGSGGGPTSQGTVSLTATVLPAIAIEVVPAGLNFGILGPRDTSDPQAITISNTGAWTALVTAEVTDDADGLFVEGLHLDGSIWSLFQTIVARGGSGTAQATLTVPEYYSGVGDKEGTLIFWATEAP